jgi:hypothetical protein
MAVQIAYKTSAQNYSSTGEEAAVLCSQTFFECTLETKNDTIQVPVQVCTQVGELRELLASQLGYIDASKLDFVVKQGCSFRKLFDTEQVLHRIHVKGIQSFVPPRHKYPHPYCIIGAGYNGIKTAMFLEHMGSQDYEIFDRYDRVGGHAWLEMANKTTKLQTEFPTYHVWYGAEFSMPEYTKCGGAPTEWELWPTRDRLLEHFKLAADDFGITPHVHFQTNVEAMDMIGKVSDKERHYNLTCVPVQYERKDVQGGGGLAHQLGGQADVHRSEGKRIKDRDPFQIKVSNIAFWPGALTFPRNVPYKGEQLFGGPVDYAVEMRFDYNSCTGKVVCINGHGAFTMENIRTCLEHSVKKIWLLCRKRNLICPRPVSWFINQSNPPISGAQILDMLSIAYKHIDFDPWTMHSVHSNKDRTHATIISKTRFGIGDVYFLGAAYGILEIKVGVIKRLTYQTIHCEDGSKIECHALLKCTGCTGDWRVDKLMKIKEMRGPFINGDVRRVCTGEADGINAAQFTTTTAGPGMYGMIKMVLHFWDVPNDWYRMMDWNILDQLPVHKAGEPDEEFPAYFYTAMHATSAGMMLGSSSPLLQTKSANDDWYKNFIQTYCCPTERILAEARGDWERYEKHFRDTGMVPADAPYVPYLYDMDEMNNQFAVHAEYCKRRYGM